MFQNRREGVIAISVLACSFLSSCMVLPPTLKSLDKIKVERSGTSGYTVFTEAVIHNPNRVRVKIKELNLGVQLDNKTLAVIGRTEDILIKRNADFTVPLSIEVKSLESVFSHIKSLFGLNASREVELSVKGNIKLRAFCFLKYEFPVQQTQKVTLPKLR